MANSTNDPETPICPITLEPFLDPVIAADGHIYERAAIVRWIETCGTSPLTRQPLNAADLKTHEHLPYLISESRAWNVLDMNDESSIPLFIVSHHMPTPTNSTCTVNNVATVFESGTMHHIRRTLFKVAWCMVFSILLTTILFLTAGIAYQSSLTNIRSREKRPIMVNSDNFTIEEQSTIKDINNKACTTLHRRLTSSSETYQCIDCRSTGHYYEAFQVDVPFSDFYDFFIESQEEIFSYLYINSFSTDDPHRNIYLSIDPSKNEKYKSNFSTVLWSHTVYILVVTTRHKYTTGSFLVKVSGSSAVDLIPITDQLITHPTGKDREIRTAPGSNICPKEYLPYLQPRLKRTLKVNCQSICHNTFVSTAETAILTQVCECSNLRDRSVTLTDKQRYSKFQTGDCIAENDDNGKLWFTATSKVQCQILCYCFREATGSYADIKFCEFRVKDQPDMMMITAGKTKSYNY